MLRTAVKTKVHAPHETNHASDRLLYTCACKLYLCCRSGSGYGDGRCACSKPYSVMHPQPQTAISHMHGSAHNYNLQDHKLEAFDPFLGPLPGAPVRVAVLNYSPHGSLPRSAHAARLEGRSPGSSPGVLAGSIGGLELGPSSASSRVPSVGGASSLRSLVPSCVV